MTDALKNLNVLYVDDDEGMRYSMKRLLSGIFAVVAVADGGEAALTQIKERRPDLMITDHDMPPGMNGPALIRRVRELYGDISIILVSGNFRFDETYAKAQGADGFLAKPFMRDDLISVCTNLLCPPDEAAPSEHPEP